MDVTVWRNAIDKKWSSYKELTKRKVVAQGWRGLGDLSNCFEVPKPTFDTNIGKRIQALVNPVNQNQENTINETFWNLLNRLDPGDIVIATEGLETKGICEIPTDSEYSFSSDVNHEYAHGVGPVEWHDVEAISEKLRIDKTKLLEKLPNSRPPGHITRVEKHADEIIEFWTRYRNLCALEKKMQQYVECLKINKQMVLTGAPGTGKTFMAKELASRLTGFSQDTSPDGFKRQVHLVQFHSSYDYPDFIEGFKPTLSQSNGTMIFELKNGAFKEFCRKAGVIERILFAKAIDQKAASCPKDVHTNLREFCNGLKEVEPFWKDWLDKQMPESISKSQENNPNLKSDLDATNSRLTEALPKFVFIIDEINRANLSKVFGELMYSLEPDLRGPEGRVKTQYASLNNDETFFVDKSDDWFFIPSNVYIIATMNEIDRSVEVFDFAMRRRFSWHEIAADEVMEDVLKKMFEKCPYWDSKIPELLKKAEDLNKFISDQQGLGPHFSIGPAYFGKIKLYGETEDAYAKLWDNHLHTLLQEYIRGIGYESSFLDNCKKAFELK